MNLVVGATGMLGSEICRRLAAEGKPVRALVRTTSDQIKVDKLRSYGVDIVQGDLRDRASLDAACRGVTAVISTASSMPFSFEPGVNDIQTVDLDGMLTLVAAAEAAGVQRFVYTSFTMDNEFPLRNAKRAVEQSLRDSDLAFTILRPSYYMEVWLSPAVGFDVANARAAVYGSGEDPISWIAVQDVAQFATAALDNPAAENRVLPLGGPEALSQLEAIRIFEQVGGRPLEKQFVPEAALEEQQNTAPDTMQESFAGLMRWYAKGDPVDMEETLRIFPVQLTSVRDYARQVTPLTA